MGVGVAVECIPLSLSLLLLSLLALAACSFEPSVICNAPYLLNGNECCLDADTNGICDSDEGKAAAAGSSCVPDCTLCPPKIIERNTTKTVTLYVCEKNGKTVESVADCLQQRNIFSGYVTMNASNSSIIRDFAVRPACRDGAHGLEVHFVSATASPGVVIETKDAPTASWMTAYEYTGGSTDKYLYGVFCDNQACASNTDFFLLPGKVYALRARFDYRTTYGVDHTSAEIIVDGSAESPYMTKLC